MKCKNCGNEIDELEIYCGQCKELLKKEKQLEKLIDENKKLNELEATIEMENLDELVNLKLETSSLKDELKDIVKIDEEELNLNKDDSNKKTIIITTSIIATILISILVIIFIILSKTKNEVVEETETINYEKIINEYGKSVNLAVSNYLKEKEEIPSWFIISDLVDYEDHEIVCSVHNIYKDGNIYLNNCKVDGTKVNYAYGEENEEIEGKKINIYKMDYEDNRSTYSDKEEGEIVGTITCNTEKCEYINAYEKYVLIKEDNEYYIYDYENSSMEFGPFNIFNDNYENNILSYENSVYGILYEKEGNKNIYNISTDKILKNIKGELLTSITNFKPNIIYKYGYAIFTSDNENNFVNLNTGNVSYTIEGEINSFIEHSTKDLVYITTYNSLNSKITIYNSNGKQLFSGKEFNDIRLLNNNIIVSNDTNFYVYDSDLKLKVTSKKYEKILGLYDDFIVLVDSGYLEIVDLEDNILATYDLKWDSSEYIFNNMLSGKTTENNKDVIYLIVENNGKTLKYYYIFDTKEFGLK